MIGQERVCYNIDAVCQDFLHYHITTLFGQSVSVHICPQAYTCVQVNAAIAAFVSIGMFFAALSAKHRYATVINNDTAACLFLFGCKAVHARWKVQTVEQRTNSRQYEAQRNRYPGCKQGEVRCSPYTQTCLYPQTCLLPATHPIAQDKKVQDI